MRRKIAVSKEVWEKLKQIKDNRTYSKVILSLLNDSGNIKLDQETYDRVQEIMKDNDYRSINETVENMIFELEKTIGE